MIDNVSTDGARQHRKLASMSLAKSLPVVSTAKFDLRRRATGAHYEVVQQRDIKVDGSRPVVEV